MQKLYRVNSSPRPVLVVAIPAVLAVLAMGLAELTSDSALWWDVAWTASAASPTSPIRAASAAVIRGASAR